MQSKDPSNYSNLSQKQIEQRRGYKNSKLDEYKKADRGNNDT